MDKKLLEKLTGVRAKLKREFFSDGRTPTICSDFALCELARLMPRELKEFTYIGGIGDIFVEKYGKYFMDVLKSYHDSMRSVVALNSKTKNTLKTLETRLVNISKRNRMLYMGKIQKKVSFDLFNAVDDSKNDELIKLIKRETKRIKICDKSAKNSNIEYNEQCYSNISALIREVSKDFRETGGYDLYIGYPFVTGKTEGEDFSVRAPMMLFPVTLKREADFVMLEVDSTKDALYNNNLILLHNKFNNLNRDLPSNICETDSLDFVSDAQNYYKESGIEIMGEEGNIGKFKEYTMQTFPKFKNGEYHLENSMVLGKFSMYSTSMQKDFKALTDDSEISELISELVSDYDSVDIYGDEVSTVDRESKDKEIEFSEIDLSYINELNSAQENAILAIEKNDKLVIQGPPGTGKSQTITSMIADAVVKGKNVIMVSQKKAALDVIHSRLGELSEFAVMLSDTKDKDLFYKQISQMIFDSENRTFDSVSLNTVSNRIDTKLKQLDDIANALYVDKTNGVEMYKIYQENANVFKELNSSMASYYSVIDAENFALKYPRLLEIHEKFTENVLLEESVNFINLYNDYEFLSAVSQRLNTVEKFNMLEEFKVFAKEQESYLSKFFIAKIFNCRKRKKALKSLIEKYFDNDKYFKELYKKPSAIVGGLDNYDKYLSTKISYDTLKSDEIDYIFSIDELASRDGISLQEANTLLKDLIVFSFIDTFESKNRIVLSSIDNHNAIIKDIEKNIGLKKTITKKQIEFLLRENYNSFISSSKRYNEFKRVVDGKRKWSIAKFMQRFAFELFKGVKIWFMTPEVVSEVLPLESNLFDILIFDEASQIYVEKGIPAIARAKKVVIAGDHKQLKPSSLGFGRLDFDEAQGEIGDEADDIEDNAALEEGSLLDLARFKYPEVLLNYHYRSRYEELIAFSNYAFYKGRLNVSPNNQEPTKPPIQVVKVDNGEWVDRSNLQEAKKVVALVKDFLFNRKNAETLGVITFNSNQRDLIMDLIDKECIKDKQFSVMCKEEFDRKENGEDIGLFIKNIENVQGDERDCIIFSVAYAKNEVGRIVRNFGWLNQAGGENRLNVAISRAKQKIYLVTSIDPSELYVDDLKNDGPKIFKKYLEYCHAVSSKDKVLAKQILMSLSDTVASRGQVTFDSDFENQVYDALVACGLEVETQVGMGGYRIDLSIRCRTTAKYILGIECDGKTYHSSKKARERDVHRQKYLESRGWTIHRIWSTNWWRDPKGEIDKILKLLKSLSGDQTLKSLLGDKASLPEENIA